MKWVTAILLMITGLTTRAQGSMQTVVPLQPIAVGTSFQVQYIVTNGTAITELQSPAFGRDFRFVSGPRLYQGEAFIKGKKVPVQNFSYTLIPLRKGRLIVKGATAVFQSGKVKSNDTFVVVTAPAQQDALTTTPASGLPRLAPGGNWEAQLQEQIFIKTSVSKQSCFVGEPVVATFTLFSRLPSASEIIKNPGFYGFSVLDVPDAAEGAQTIQTHNGTFYNTHILRKVQLYPAQAGNLVIDKMSVHNAIDYADSATGAPVHTTVLLESKPLPVSVKPLPATTVENFSGAVGRFSINAYVKEREWRQNDNGNLLLTINGAGDFLQLAAPEVEWPTGIDIFEPSATGQLQKDKVPVAGTRTYTYTLTADSTGDYTIPPIAFTYFDPAEKAYKTTTTDSVHFTVHKGRNRLTLPFTIKRPQGQSNTSFLWLTGIVVMVTGILCFAFYRRRKKGPPTPEATTRLPDAETRIQEISPTDAEAYRRLQQEVMGFLKSAHLQSAVAKPGTLQAAATLPDGPKKELQAILDECEAVQYYRAAPTVPFSTLQHQALRLIQTVKQYQGQAPERT